MEQTDKIFDLTTVVDVEITKFVNEAFDLAVSKAKNVHELKQYDLHSAVGSREMNVPTEINEWLWLEADTRFRRKIFNYIAELPVKYKG